MDGAMKRFVLRQALRLMFVSAAIALVVSPNSPRARCVAQDFELTDELNELEDELAAEADAFEEEFTAEFGGDDFEDLPPVVQAVIIIVGLLFFLAMLGIGIFILYLLYSYLKALPPEYRLMDPTLVWLLLIPCFNIIWNFFVFPRIARSYQNFFVAHGRPDVGDCGAGIGVAYAVCNLLVSIPCLNYITGIFCGPAMLVLLIIYLVRLHGLKNQVQTGTFALADEGQSPFLK
jgi:hypothetical protein